MLAALARCKLSTFPLQYLGVPLFEKKIKICEWQGIIDKVQGKTQNWKVNLLSLSGESLY
jgi:hypothetical protein